MTILPYFCAANLFWIIAHGPYLQQLNFLEKSFVFRDRLFLN